ncbi:MAG: uroporphyrinogen decarboxylase family protein [bacterium]
MGTETMTSEERFLSAIRLEKPDRVPLAPQMSTAAAVRLLGLESSKIPASGVDVQFAAHLEVFEAYGGWDAMNPIASAEGAALAGLRVRIPTEGETQVQVVESQSWSEEEYDEVARTGWPRFCAERLLPRVSQWAPEDAPALLQKVMEDTLAFCAECRKRGVAPAFPMWTMPPFFSFSLTRSMVRFTEDLYYRPERVERALKVAVPEYIEQLIGLSRLTGCKIANITEERAGAFFYPLRVFERFWWPYTVEIVDALWSEGIVSWFHLDTCWDKNLPYFKRLPRGSAVIDLDGTTDIFAAKEVLGGHHCIASDVHPALLCLGTPEDVSAYCRRLISEIGRDGGFILSTGCTVPAAVKPENFRAFIDTGKTYEFAGR